MAEKIYLEGAKGGVGCTTVACGLGMTLSAAGERTLILDGDSRCGSALSVSGCTGMQVFTVADYQRGACRAKQAIVQHPKYKNLYIMPTLGCADIAAAEDAIREVDGLFDYILCDGTALKACKRAIIVTEPYLPAIKAADGAACRLKDGGARLWGIIVNKVNGGLIADGRENSPEDIAAALNVPLVAALPEDLELTLGQWRPYSLKYYRAAVARIRGRQTKIPEFERGYSGAGGFFRKKMREKI